MPPGRSGGSRPPPGCSCHRIWPRSFRGPSRGPKSSSHPLLYLRAPVPGCAFLLPFSWCNFKPPYYWRGLATQCAQKKALKWPLQTLEFGASLGGKKEGRIRVPAKDLHALVLTRKAQFPIYSTPLCAVIRQFHIC